MSILEQFNEQTNDITSKKSNFFRFEKGENKFRILSEGAVIGTHFIDNKGYSCYGKSKGCPRHDEGAPIRNGKPIEPSVKYCVYILDRSDNTIKLADLPYTVIKRVDELQKDDDWAFTEFPMPYDIKVTFAGKDSAPVDMYSVLASPNRNPLTDEQLRELNTLLEKNNPKDIIAKKKLNQMEEDKINGVWKQPEGTSLTEEEIANLKALREKEIASRNEESELRPEDIPF